jgi:hypothetical protein
LTALFGFVFGDYILPHSHIEHIKIYLAAAAYKFSIAVNSKCSLESAVAKSYKSKRGRCPPVPVRAGKGAAMKNQSADKKYFHRHSHTTNLR